MSAATTADEATMAAAVYRRPGVLEVVRRPRPEPGPTQVVVEVAYCGVCGTDLHEVLEGWGMPDTVGGHEYAGVVVAVGEAVTRWAPGDRVVPGAEPGCGRCAPCRAGHEALCLARPTPGTVPFEGAFAGYVPVEETALVALPDHLDLRAAALAEPLSVAVHAIERGGIEPGHRVLVSGAGPIGALALAALVAGGVTDVDVVEPGRARAELAARLGAQRVRHPGDLDVPSMAEPGRVVDDAYDVVLETSGRRPAMEAGLAQLVRRGTLVIVGSGIDPPRIDPNRVLLNELVVTGAFASDAAGCQRAIDLLAGGRLPVDVLVEPDVVGLPDLLPTMQRLATGEVAGKVLVAPRLGAEAVQP